MKKWQWHVHRNQSVIWRISIFSASKVLLVQAPNSKLEAKLVNWSVSPEHSQELGCGYFQFYSRELSAAVPQRAFVFIIELKIVTAYVIPKLSLEFLSVVQFIVDDNFSRGAVWNRDIVEAEITFSVREKLFVFLTFVAAIPGRLKETLILRRNRECIALIWTWSHKCIQIASIQIHPVAVITPSHRGPIAHSMTACEWKYKKCTEPVKSMINV